LLERTEFPTKPIQYLPSHLQYVATLPCKRYKFEFWENWNKMQTKKKDAMIF